MAYLLKHGITPGMEGADLPLAEMIGCSVISDDERTIEVPVSSSLADRDGDVIRQKGIEHTEPNIVLWAHNWYGQTLPLGVITAKRIEEVKVRRGVTADVTIETHKFAPPGGDGNPMDITDAVWRLIRLKIIKATSIGFLAKIRRNVTDPVERAALGLSPDRGSYFESVEKVETSWVPIGSNREAVRRGISDALFTGALEPAEAASMFGKGMLSQVGHRVWVPGWEQETPEDLPLTDEAGSGSKTFMESLVAEAVEKAVGGTGPDGSEVRQTPEPFLTVVHDEDTTLTLTEE